MPTHDFGGGPVAAHRHTNPDGSSGGWIADTATVAPTCWVGDNARIQGNARIGGDAIITKTTDHLVIHPLGREGLTLARTETGHTLRAGCETTTIPGAREALLTPEDIWPDDDDEQRALFVARWTAGLDMAAAIAAGWETSC